MRSAGYTVPAISSRLNVSPNALNTIFRKTGTKRGELSVETLEAAKNQLLLDSGFLGEIRGKIASCIVSDIAISTSIQESLILTLETLNDSDLDAGVKSRALAALSATAKNCSETLRKALNVNDNSIVNEESIPVLEVRKMTEAEEFAEKNRMKTSGLAVVKDNDDD